MSWIDFKESRPSEGDQFLGWHSEGYAGHYIMGVKGDSEVALYDMHLGHWDGYWGLEELTHWTEITPPEETP